MDGYLWVTIRLSRPSRAGDTFVYFGVHINIPPLDPLPVALHFTVTSFASTY